MSQTNDWLAKVYINDILEFLRSTFSKWFPRINAKITETAAPLNSAEKTIASEQHSLSEIESGSWYATLKPLLVTLGMSVLFLGSSPLICAFIWQNFRASRWFNKKDIADCGIVVTGCDSGIGIETVAVLSEAYPRALIFAGCRTIRGIERLTSVERRNLIPLQLDVTIDSEINTFCRNVRTRLGDKKLYAIVNNAGVFDGSLFEVTTTDIYRRVMDVNFFGAVRVTKALLPLLGRENAGDDEGGRIINVSSLAAALSSPGNTVYCSSKHALAAFSDGLRQELREIGIRVIQVVPGPVRTESLKQIAVSTNTLISAGPQEVLQRCGGHAFLAANTRYFADLQDSAVPPLSIARIIQRTLISKYPKDVYYNYDRIYNLLSICPHFARDFLMDPKTFREQIMSRYG